MKILSLEAANVKRLKAIEIIPTGPLVKLAGKNKQGKTSTLDAIMWALGGTASIQAKPIREGEKEAVIRLTLGGDTAQLLVERKITEKGEYLKVKNADGSTPPGGPQGILDKMTGRLTFDPVAFMREKPADQLATLRSLVTLTDEKGEPLNMTVLDAQRKAAYDDRTDFNRDYGRVQARADAVNVPADLPEAAPDVSALVQEMAEVSNFNGEIEKEKSRRLNVENDRHRAMDNVTAIADEIARIEAQLEDARQRAIKAAELVTAYDAEIDGFPPLAVHKDAAEIEQRIAAARQIEEGLKARTQKAELVAEAAALKEEAEARTKIIEGVDKTKAEAVARAKMPVPGLGFGETGVLFNGLPLDQASDAEQLQVSVAIAAALNPALRVMRVRDGSILDSVAMAALEQFGADNDYQIWVEIVDESGEVGVVIEDGGVRGQELTPEAVLSKGKGETTPAQEAAQEAAPPAEPPNEERLQAARAFLTGVLADLDAIRKDAPDGAQQVAALHGKVKAKLKNFPDMIAAEWNPAKLAKESGLKPKRAAE